MQTTDRNMLLMIDILKTLGIIRFNKEFCDGIGIKPQNLNNIKNGKNHFTPEHILQAVITFNVNANWIFGVSDKMFLNHHFDPRLGTNSLKEKSSSLIKK